MIFILYPEAKNWFYAEQAKSIAFDLAEAGLNAAAVPSTPLGLSRLAAAGRELILVVNLAETLVAAEEFNCKSELIDSLWGFKRRILVNYDCIWTQWFKSQFQLGDHYFTDIFDVTMEPQHGADTLNCATYHWIREGIFLRHRSAMQPWTPDRPVPWAIIAHASQQRATFVAACMRILEPHGLVFCPNLGPYGDTYGLGYAAQRRILERATFFLWCSHHKHPYHEALRAPLAIEAGAIPIKIDPLYASISGLPWVFPSLEAFTKTYREVGAAALFKAARARVLSHVPGRQIADILRSMS